MRETWPELFKKQRREKRLAALSGHSNECSGCPACSEAAAVVLRTAVAVDSGERPIPTGYDSVLGAVGDVPALEYDANGTPDIYGPALRPLRARAAVEQDDTAQLRVMAEFRTAMYATALSGRLGALPPATSNVHAAPPDAYEAGLKILRERDKC